MASDGVTFACMDGHCEYCLSDSCACACHPAPPVGSEGPPGAEPNSLPSGDYPLSDAPVHDAGTEIMEPNSYIVGSEGPSDDDAIAELVCRVGIARLHGEDEVTVPTAGAYALRRRYYEALGLTYNADGTLNPPAPVGSEGPPAAKGGDFAVEQSAKSGVGSEGPPVRAAVLAHEAAIRLALAGECDRDLEERAGTCGCVWCDAGRALDALTAAALRPLTEQVPEGWKVQRTGNDIDGWTPRLIPDRPLTEGEEKP